MNVKRIPMTHGMEVEQFGLPREISEDPNNQYWGTWEHDPSGPREIEFGPGKHVKRLIDGFNKTARQNSDTPWQWVSSDGNSGAGSHVHFNVERVGDRETTVGAWTIAHNTLVELVPFLAPFFCHNWEDGFRDGTQYRSSELNIEHWASGKSQRFSRDTMRQHYQNPTRTSRGYQAVTMNPEERSGNKPLTLELRLSDSHPAFALTGCYFLRKITKRCYERDWSVKIDKQASETGDVIKTLYERIYHLDDGENLISTLKKPLYVEFEDDRAVPKMDKSYACPYDLLEDIIIDLLPQRERADRRACNLIRHAGDLVESRREDPFITNVSEIPNPARNRRAIWHMDKPSDEFYWDCGP